MRKRKTEREGGKREREVGREGGRERERERERHMYSPVRHVQCTQQS